MLVCVVTICLCDFFVFCNELAIVFAMVPLKNQYRVEINAFVVFEIMLM